MWCNTGLMKCVVLPQCRFRRIKREDLIAFMEANNMPTSELVDAPRGVWLIACDSRTIYALSELLAVPISVAASSDEVGLRWANTSAAAIVIDFSLGHGEALTLARELQLIRKFRYARYFAIVGEDCGYQSEIVAAGFDEVFQTPFDLSLLAALLGG